MRTCFAALLCLGFTASAQAQADVLVVRDFLPSGGDSVAEFQLLGANVTEIGSTMLPAATLENYCVVYISGMETSPGMAMYDIPQAQLPRLESYVASGGVLLFETGAEVPFSLPGGVQTEPWLDWENFVIQGHPATVGLPSMLSANCGAFSTHYFVNLPPNFQTLTTTTWLDRPATVSYQIGAGEVLATAAMAEFGMTGSTCLYQGDATAVLWRALAEYSISGCEDVEAVEVPTSFGLQPNVPNPFNPATTLHFSLAETESMRLSVFNLQGQEVALLQNGLLEAGEHQIQFAAEHLASGVYIARLETATDVDSQRLLLLK